jgi:hypothetical protein
MTQRTDGQNAQIERHTRARKPERGIFEKVPCSGVWWIRYADATGRIRREKAGTWSAADKLYRKRKTEVLEGRKLPETLRESLSLRSRKTRSTITKLTKYAKPTGLTAATWERYSRGFVSAWRRRSLLKRSSAS